MRRQRSHRLLLLTILTAPAVALVVAAPGCGSGDAPSTAIVDGSSAPEAESGPGPVEAGDASTDGGAPGDTGTDASVWTPAQLDAIGELALWLEPSPASFTVTGGVIARWSDRSKNHNDATSDLSGPTVHASVLNGHDTVHFAATELLSIGDAPSLRFATQPFYLAAVARLIPSDGLGYLFTKTTAVPSGAGPQYSSGFEVWAGKGSDDAGATVLFPSARIASSAGSTLSWSESVFDDGKFHYVAVRRIDASTLAMTVDRLPDRTATTDLANVDEVGKAASLGGFARSSFHPPLDFDIAELLIVHGPSGAVSDVEAEQIRSYLTAKYGL